MKTSTHSASGTVTAGQSLNFFLRAVIAATLLSLSLLIFWPVALSPAAKERITVWRAWHVHVVQSAFKLQPPQNNATHEMVFESGFKQFKNAMTWADWLTLTAIFFVTWQAFYLWLHHLAKRRAEQPKKGEK